MEKNKKVENNTLYTRCPTCTTAFKVTEKLLNAAAGKVRCGACLAIFQATDYMLKPSERNNNPQSAVTKLNETPAAATETHNDTADSIVDQPLSSQPTSEPITETTLENQPSEQSLRSDEYESEPQFEPPSQPIEQLDFETEPDFENQAPITPESDSKVIPENHDLAITDSQADPEIDLGVVTDIEQEDLSSTEELQDTIIESDESLGNTEEISDFDFQNEPDEFEDEQAEFGPVIEQNSLDIQPTEHDLQRTEPSIGETDDIDPIEEDLNSDSREIQEATTDVSMADVNEEELNHADENQRHDSFQEIDPNVRLEEQDDFEVDDLSGQLSEQMLDTDAEPDPLDEFESIVEEKNTDLRRNIILAVVAILVFIGLQQVWSNRQALAWSESWGETIKSVCQYLPCELKARRDVTKIRLLQRQLSPDEENENQLDVKVLLTNEASFDQPYPTIKIAFSNKNGEQVSVKSFSPQDYLEPDSLNKLMPYGTEVHIHFKTELTHPDALGFEFIFE